MQNQSLEIPKNNYKILCVGEILWDMLPTGPKAGGAPMNVAIHLKKFGMGAVFTGRVGNDQLGIDLKNFLIRHGLDTNLVQTDYELPTSTVKVHLGENHRVNFEIVENVAWDRLALTNDLQKVAEESNVVVFGTLASRDSITRETVFSLLEKCSVKLIDVNLRPPFNKKELVEKLIMRADIAKLNDDELNYISSWYSKSYDEKDQIEWFSEKYNCNMVCVTKGENGAVIYSDGQFYEHSGYTVKVADTVGSGDAFLAGFLAKYLSGTSLEKTLDFACATGALVATKAGGTPDYKLEEISLIQRMNMSNQ